MARFHDVQQNEDEWYRLRAGRVGGSSIGKIMANYGKAFGQPAKDLAVKIAIEQLTGEPQGSHYSNEHMERGHEQEPIARALYEDVTFCTVTNGGFFESGLCGVSPDGLVDNDGLIEIKSVLAHVHYNNVERGGVDPAYKWQIYFNLQVTGREWIDFVSFCADFPQDKKLFIYRVWAKDAGEQFAMLDNRMGQFKDLVRDRLEVIRESHYF